jgi:hypothetical protein
MIVGFMIMHYGSDYAGYAIQSIYDQIDHMLVAYAPVPSHGFRSGKSNPDSRESCRNSIYTFGDPKNKIEWVEGAWSDEGKHRSVIWEKYPQSKLVCVIDADEIWHPEQFAAVKNFALKTPKNAFKLNLRTPWRSFNWICDDGMAPDRFYMPGQKGFLVVPREVGIFYHMGYAREAKHVEYKMSCHGHSNELRRNWFPEKFLRWEKDKTIADVHPTCVGIWNPQPFDKNLLPPILRQHPYWSKDVI